MEKKKFYVSTPKGKNPKFEKIDFFQRKSKFLHLNMSSTHSKLSFEVPKIGFAQNFHIFTFLPINFPSMTNFIR